MSRSCWLSSAVTHERRCQDRACVAEYETVASGEAVGCIANRQGKPPENKKKPGNTGSQCAHPHPPSQGTQRLYPNRVA